MYIVYTCKYSNLSFALSLRKLQFFMMVGTVAPRSSIQIWKPGTKDWELQTWSNLYMSTFLIHNNLFPVSFCILTYNSSLYIICISVKITRWIMWFLILTNRHNYLPYPYPIFIMKINLYFIIIMWNIFTQVGQIKVMISR